MGGIWFQYFFAAAALHPFSFHVRSSRGFPIGILIDSVKGAVTDILSSGVFSSLVRRETITATIGPAV